MLYAQAMTGRRRFLQRAGAFAATILPGSRIVRSAMFPDPTSKEGVDAHCWVYASHYPPDWDATPALETIFSEIKAAGYDRIELMESIIRHEGSVERLKAMIKRYQLPVGGCSYYGDFWDGSQEEKLIDDVKLVIGRLNEIGATMIGITVGDAERQKTVAELDLQASTLGKVMDFCKGTAVTPNLHNHIFEVKNGLYDLKGTLARLPDVKLGPDLNWLVRAGVDPVGFIETYGHQMIYMHLRDQDATGKWTEALGEGVIDFQGIAAALKRVGYGGRMAVELALDAPASRPIAEDWQISRRFVKKVFNR